MRHLPTFFLPAHKRLELHGIWNMSLCPRVLVLGFEADELLRALAQEWFPDCESFAVFGQTCFCPDVISFHQWST